MNDESQEVQLKFKRPPVKTFSALAFACPRCKAEAGSLCCDGVGIRNGSPHVERLTLAKLEYEVRIGRHE